jgi:hypothetical protein
LRYPFATLLANSTNRHPDLRVDMLLRRFLLIYGSMALATQPRPRNHVLNSSGVSIIVAIRNVLFT